jgi:cobyrinic acid a,c-diamide synthase
MRRHDESVRRIVDKNGASHRFGGLLPGRSVMQKRLAALGTQFADLPEGRLAGHTLPLFDVRNRAHTTARAVAAKG